MHTHTQRHTYSQTYTHTDKQLMGVWGTRKSEHEIMVPQGDMSPKLPRHTYRQTATGCVGNQEVPWGDMSSNLPPGNGMFTYLH